MPRKRIPSDLQVAIRHFPGHKKVLETLHRRDQSFRSLCKDFSDCIKAVAYWCNSPAGQEHAPEICKEYRALCADLKKEIKQCLVDINKEV
jgi:hypothetical protein